LDIYGALWNPIVHCGTPQKAIEAYGTLWKVMEHYGILWKVLEDYISMPYIDIESHGIL
jgi:hypothetical protein